MKKMFSTLFSALAIAAVVSLSSLTAFAADTTPPSDVENLKGTALNAAVDLTWNKATDDTAVKGYHVHYGKSSVTQTGQSYDTKVDAGNVLKYSVTGIENGTKYYFSVVAYDAAGNESQAWAKELSLTPSDTAGSVEDKEAPQVSDSTSLNKVEVKVVFSEEIVLPVTDPQDAFTIENDENFEALIVSAAKMDETDKTNKTVILTTAEQKDGTDYKLTVGIDIEDKSGNPIISGTSDTAVFKGTGTEKPSVDAVGPEVLTAGATDSTHVSVTFNEPVVLTIDPSEDFTVVEEADATKTLEVLGVELIKNSAGIEDTVAVVTTSVQSQKSYILTVQKLTDEAGNEVNAVKSGAIFTGLTSSSGDDKTPPKDVSDFVAKSLKEAEKYIAALSWKNPAENKGDSVAQVLYLSKDKGEKYEKNATVDPDSAKYDVKDLKPGEYWFKLTQKDAAGNESTGIVAKLILTETGPELLGLVLVSIGLGRFFAKKKGR